MKYKIYTITDTNDNVVYVGYTHQSLTKRWQQHIRNARNGSEYAFHRAIRKYGEQAFKINLIDGSDDRDFALLVLEPLHIVNHETHSSRGGYNMTWGGDKPPNHLGMKRSEETRKKMSVALKEKWKGEKRKPFTSEHLANLSAAQKANWSRRKSAKEFE